MVFPTLLQNGGGGGGNVILKSPVLQEIQSQTTMPLLVYECLAARHNRWPGQMHVRETVAAQAHLTTGSRRGAVATVVLCCEHGDTPLLAWKNKTISHQNNSVRDMCTGAQELHPTKRKNVVACGPQYTPW